jgi:hypothetical protein
MVIALLVTVNVSACNAETEQTKTVYEIPTFISSTDKFTSPISPLSSAVDIDADAIFNRIINCFPIRSSFRIETEIIGSARTAPGYDSVSNTVARSYVGVVAKMPLYSAIEIEREIEWERKRRADVAESIALFKTSIALRNQAIRHLSIYRQLERRSQIRVNLGIIDANEQIGFLEKVINSEAEKVKAESDILKSRLILSAMCKPELHDDLNNYLISVSEYKQK